MKKLFSACILLLWRSFLFAQKAPPMPKFEEAVSFYISFDDGTRTTLGIGDEPIVLGPSPDGK